MTIKQSIDKLQRQDLSLAYLELPDPSSYLAGFSLHRIRSIGRPSENDLYHHQTLMEDVITGQYSSGSSILFMIVGLEKDISIYFGSKDRSLRKVLLATFKGLCLEAPKDFLGVSGQIPDMDIWGAMTGTPTALNGKEGNRINLQIERLIKGMYGETWVYLILAQPIDQRDTQEALRQIVEEIKGISYRHLTKGTLREDNRTAREYLELLEISFEKFKLGSCQGMWAVQNYILTSTQEALKRAFMLLESIYQGEDSRPQPIRTHRCSLKYNRAKPVATLLNSKDLSILIQLPQEEMPGYSLRSYNRFDVDLKKETIHPIAVGEVLDHDRSLGYWFELERDDLASHLLVAGVTGAGKTNSLMFLLDQLWREQDIPFLVIEPAKHEYRALIESDGFDGLQFYSLGDERISPFRLNPFEVQKGSLIQSHIDYLKSVFNASFSMYPPMPYILEESILRVYEDRGWDLTTNLNRNGLGPDSFPTLKDLYSKIEGVVAGKGYDEKIRTDIVAALKTRINNLMIGAKGLMFNSQSSVGIQQLLDKPTILELEAIGDDEEKAFIIGLILAKIYEYRKTQRNTSQGLKHITLIEEAHRLLRNVPFDIPQTEVANLRGKAVEAFCNILSEIRSYGEGIWLAEQMPSKLAPDARKNTQTKILFRTPSRDEVKVMGDAMNLKEEEEEFIASLETGQALVFSKGMDRPVLVKVPNYKQHRLGGAEITDGKLRRHLGRGLPFRKGDWHNG